jgi:hypothetical protein
MNEFLLDVLVYALWCWGAYALNMGSFMVNARDNSGSITRTHVLVCFVFSAFGVYSFIFAFVRSTLNHGFLFPISWNQGIGSVPPKQD